jgi:hypothetical protein
VVCWRRLYFLFSNRCIRIRLSFGSVMSPEFLFLTFHVLDLAKKSMAVDEADLLFVTNPTSISLLL